jgi:probable rRNA maturation factor
MISFNYETGFDLDNEQEIADWIGRVIESEGKTEGEINYIFCDDDYLLEKNKEFLNHDTLTDIISFDYTMGNLISGDIFISIERVKDNAIDYRVDFINELMRVMVHGVLHYIGYTDKTEEGEQEMRDKEDEKLAMFENGQA